MEHYYYCSLLDFFQQFKYAKTILSFQAVRKQVVEPKHQPGLYAYEIQERPVTQEIHNTVSHQGNAN